MPSIPIRPTSYSSVTFEGSFFDTRQQIELRSMKPLTSSIDPGGSDRTVYAHSEYRDAETAAKLVGADRIVLSFSRKSQIKENVTSEPKYLPVSQTTTDSDGNTRSILSGDIDLYVSSSVYPFLNGVEITDDKKWIRGAVKITSGEPGHLLYRNRFGVPDLSVIDADKYIEFTTVDPLNFIKTGGSDNVANYPIVMGDTKDALNYERDGLIEPLSIRGDTTGMSVYYPFEPKSFRASLESGNYSVGSRSDQVLSVDEFIPRRPKKKGDIFTDPYFDSYTVSTMATDDGSTVVLGRSDGYVKLETLNLRPWNDYVPSRMQNQYPTYTSEMIAALQSMLTSSVHQTYTNAGEVYVNDRQKSGTTGFVYNGASQGTDSIAFGGLAY